MSVANQFVMSNSNEEKKSGESMMLGNNYNPLAQLIPMHLAIPDSRRNSTTSEVSGLNSPNNEGSILVQFVKLQQERDNLKTEIDSLKRDKRELASENEELIRKNTDDKRKAEMEIARQLKARREAEQLAETERRQKMIALDLHKKSEVEKAGLIDRIANLNITIADKDRGLSSKDTVISQLGNSNSQLQVAMAHAVASWSGRAFTAENTLRAHGL